MPRQAKQHIRNPVNRVASICGRSSVSFVEKDSMATCGKCRQLAVDGTLERLRFDGKAGAQNNNKGRPQFTEMQRKFAASPIVTTNPEKAALDAGYSQSYAKSHARALREQLSPLIMEVQEKAKQLSAISVSRVQTELASMGFANVIDYFNIDPDSGAMKPKGLNELTREQAAAIQEVKLVDYEDEDGNTHFVIGSLKLADKRANLVELGKTLGMFNKITIEDKRESTLLMQDVPTDALEQAESLLLAAASQAKENRSKRDAMEGEFTALPSGTGETDGSQASKD